MIVLPSTSLASRACATRSLRLYAANVPSIRCAFPVNNNKTLGHVFRSLSRTARLCQEGTTLPSPEPPKTWVDRVPPKIKPYLLLARMDKPIGTLLLFYPCGEHRLVEEKRAHTHAAL